MSEEKTYTIELTESEMQMIIYAVTGFYRRTNQEKLKISPHQTALILNAFHKMKRIVDINQLHTPPLVSIGELDGEDSSTNTQLKS